MKKNKSFNHTNADPSAVSDPYLSGSVSSDTECTGLMPAPPASEAEMEAYKELYPFDPARAVDAGKSNS